MDLRGGDIRISAAQLPGDIGTRPSLQEDLRVVAEALGSRWMLILAVVIVCLGGGIAYMWQATPSYKSAVDILMDPRPRTIVGLDVVPTGLGSSSLGSDTGLVDSQVQLLSSRTLLTQVIHKLDLDQLPAKPAHASIFGGVASLARTLLYGPNQSDFEAGTPFDRTLAALQSSLKIERLGNTYVLRVTVTSDSSQRAADIANAIAAAYVSQGQDAVNQETRSTADALTARLAQLKASSDQAQQALEAYRRDHGLIAAAGVTVDEQQLRDLNDEVTKASVDAQTARAHLAEIDRLKGLPASALAATNVMTSPTAEALRAQLDQAVADEQSLAGIYGRQHPTLILARQKRQALETALLQEFNRIEGRAASDYQAALDAQKRLQTLLTQYEQRQADSNEAGIQLKALQTAADNAHTLYDSFAQRAAQAREQVDLPTTTIRVISPAEPSPQPSDPRPALVLGTAFGVGLALGVGLAWLLHLLSVRRQVRVAAPLEPAPAPPRRGIGPATTPFGRRQPRDAASVAGDAQAIPAMATRQNMAGLFR